MRFKLRFMENRWIKTLHEVCYAFAKINESAAQSARRPAHHDMSGHHYRHNLILKPRPSRRPVHQDVQRTPLPAESNFETTSVPLVVRNRTIYFCRTKLLYKAGTIFESSSFEHTFKIAFEKITFFFFWEWKFKQNSENLVNNIWKMPFFSQKWL